MSCEQSEKLLQLDLALVSCDRLLASLSAQRTTYSDRWAELWLPSCREPGFDSLIPLLRNAVVPLSLVSLVTLTVQNSALTIVLHYASRPFLCSLLVKPSN